MKRREALVRLGVGAAGLMVGGRGLARAPEVQPLLVADLAQRIRSTPIGEIFPMAASAIASGAEAKDLLAAAFVAGVHDVRPRPVGGNLHSVMVVESSYRLVERASTPEQAMLVALWTIHGFKETQNQDDGWVLPPAPENTFKSEAQARKELIAALEAWDDERADRAIVGLLPYHDRQSLYEILWPYSARCMAYLGHKIVYGAMTEAVLRRIDWDHAEPTLRSLVYGIVGRGRGEPLTRAWESSVALAEKLPEGWANGENEGRTLTENVLGRLVGGTYQEAQQAVIDAYGEGASTRAVWDAIRLAASDLFLRRRDHDPESGEAIRAVHAVTELWCMGYAWRSAADEQTKRQLMLQAAGWIPELRDALLEREAISMKTAGIVTLGAVATADETDVAGLFERNDPAAARVYLDRNPEMIPGYLETMREQVVPKVLEYHQYKYVIAIEDESRLASPRWATRVLAPGLGYMPTASTRDTELTERARHALRTAKVL